MSEGVGYGEISGQEVNVVHVGGGVRNELLCRLTADAPRRLVRAEPAEATAPGNLAVQAYADGRLASQEEIRAAVRRSMKVRDYESQGGEDGWQEALKRLRAVTQEVPSQLDEGGESA